MAEQRERAKADARAKKGAARRHGRLPRHLRRVRPHRVAGLRDARDRVAARSRCSAAARRCRASREGEVGELVLDRTPFYAESGGQVADAGTIVFDGGRLEVLDVQRPIKGLVVHQVRVLEGELDPGARGPRPRRPGVAHRRAPGALRHPRRARRPARGARPHRAAVRLLQPARLPPPRLRLDAGAEPRAGPRHRARLAAGAARRPARVVGLHDARAGQGVGRDRALRRDLRQHQGARRRDRRALVARALRRHARRPLLADRHRRGDRRDQRRLGQPPHRGAHRCRGLRLPRPRARRRRPADRPAQDPARRPGRPGAGPHRAPQGGREGAGEGARSPSCSAPAPTLAAGATQVGPVKVVAHRADGAGGGDVRNLAMDVRGRLPQGEPGCRGHHRPGRRQGVGRGRHQRRGACPRAVRRRAGPHRRAPPRRQGRRQGRRRPGRRHRRLAHRRGARAGDAARSREKVQG